MTSGEFHARRVLVTGGTSGIGAAIARGFIEAGANVMATGLTLAEVEICRQQLPAARFTPAVLDVTDDEAIAKLLASFDRLDVLVNCAGVILRQGAEFDPARFAQVVDVNLNGTMRMCVACRPLLSVQGGAIVNTASMLSFFGSGLAPAYSSSKGGVAQLTKSLAIAWAKDRIRVNAVAPGWIVTPLTQPLVDDPGRKQSIVDRTPLGRWGSPEDVVGAVTFLCSSRAAFITGVVLPVDGGYSIA